MTDQCMTPNDPCADPDSCTSVECARDRLHVTLRDEADQRESHLPECREYRWNTDANACICPALRACEARVAQESYPLLYAKGYAAALDAARDAVAALSFGPLDRDQGPAATQRQALAAIEALRGES